MRLFTRSSLLPLLAFAGALALRVVDPAPIQTLRNLVFDTYQRWEPRIYQDVGIRIIDLDDESLARIGQWPWPRTEVARLLDRLREFGTAAVALDIVFAEPDRTSPKNIVPIWQETTSQPLSDLTAALPDHDELLAQQIGRMPTVLGAILVNQGGTQPRPRWGIAAAGEDVTQSLVSFESALENLPVLQSHAAGLGMLNAYPDRDGVIRSAPLFFALKDGSKYPALLAEALRVGTGASTYLIQGTSAGMSGVRVGPLSIPTDGRGRVVLYDTGHEAQRTIPAWQVLSGSVDPSQLANKLVFIGTSAAGLGDLRTTPLRPLVPGVEVHAQIGEQILLGGFLQRPNWTTGAELCWMAVLSALLLLCLGLVGPSWAAVIGAVAVLSAGVASWLAFSRFGLLVDPIYPALTALALYLIQSLRHYIRTEGDRRYLKDAFGRYISPHLLEQLAKDSSRLKLGGETREMSIMFCDIRGFTTLAESMDAEALTHLVNGFFTPMTACVLEHSGTIDKYIGDCLMAFWNAPLPEPRHAEFAVRAALDMRKAVTGINDKRRQEAEAAGQTFIPIGIGVGIATGLCCVGNHGSEQRFAYSVLGDTVNLASRLEGQTKTYHAPIVVSEPTHDQLTGFATLELDLLRVKGKMRPTRIFVVLGDESMAATEDFVALVAEHKALLEEYRRGNWEEAAGRIDTLYAMAPESIRDLYLLYAERIEEFILSPPRDWDGVTVAETK